MLSKTEFQFLKSPESFDADYRRVLRHRIKAKTAQMQDGLTVLEASGLSVTKNCNSVTEFCNGQQNQINPNHAAFGNRKWAEPDLNRRPLARKANVLTKLDDRPAYFGILKLGLSCLD